MDLLIAVVVLVLGVGIFITNILFIRSVVSRNREILELRIDDLEERIHNFESELAGLDFRIKVVYDLVNSKLQKRSNINDLEDLPKEGMSK